MGYSNTPSSMINSLLQNVFYLNFAETLRTTDTFT